jgi:hypothetical protein
MWLWEQTVEKQQFLYHKVTSVRRMFCSHGGKCFWRDLTYFVQFCEHSKGFLDIPFWFFQAPEMKQIQTWWYRYFLCIFTTLQCICMHETTWALLDGFPLNLILENFTSLPKMNDFSFHLNWTILTTALYEYLGWGYTKETGNWFPD